MKSKLFRVALVLLLVSVSASAFAEVIDFEGYNLNNGDPIPQIGVASFIGTAARQGSVYAFYSAAGPGTGKFFPFNAIGNTFITNPGGLGAAWNEKTIEIYFSEPVYDFSFFAADIDSADPAIERLTAKLFDAADNLLDEKSYNETTLWSGDGNVIKFDFTGVSGIRRVTITLDNIGSNYTANDIGFGVDNIEFKILSLPIPITIDIKPGSDPNSINLKSRGVVPVAILGSADFEVTSINPGTVLFADAFPVKWSLEDVNQDGFMDMILHFRTQDLNLTQDSTEAKLTGETMEGVLIEGADTVNIVPKKKK